MTTAQAVAAFETQGTLEPGTQGWWKVWGASVQNIVAGDLVLVPASHVSEDPEWVLIADTFTAKAAPLRYGFLDEDGRKFTLGTLCPVAVVRQGTHNILSRSAR